MAKKIIAIILTAVIVFSMAACGNSGVSLSGSGNYITHIQLNNITAESYEPDELSKGKKEKDHYNALKISGLADRDVNNIIEEAVIESIVELKEAPMPDYAGIEKSFSGKPLSETITAKVKGSLNNILSVLVTKTVYQSGSSWTDTRTLNFDLRNGEVLSLEDLFSKESKPGSKLMECCLTYLKDEKALEEKGEPELTEDQKYYLDVDGIHVLFDYATGGVKTTGYKAAEAVVNFNSVYEVLDIEQCLTEESLFEDSEPVYMLIASIAELEETENNIPDRTDLAMMQYLSWPVDIPDSVLKAFMADAEVNDNEIKEVEKISKAGEGVFHYNDMANCKRVGNYYNIVRSKSVFGPGIWTEDKTGCVYDSKGKRIALKDAFIEGTDYKKIILAALKESLSKYYENDTYAGKTLEEVYKGLSFNLDTNGICFWTEGLNLTNDNGDKREASVNFFIEYEKFGCENMTIFN